MKYSSPTDRLAVLCQNRGKHLFSQKRGLKKNWSIDNARINIREECTSAVCILRARQRDICLSSLKTPYDNTQSVIKFNSQPSVSGYKGHTIRHVRSH